MFPNIDKSKERMQAAVTLRLARLRAAWEAFVEAGRPLFVLRMLPADRPLLSAFLQMEGTEAGELPDVFIRLDTPFWDAEGYTSALADAVAEVHADTALDLGLSAPSLRSATFLGAVEGFLEDYGHEVRVLGVLLEPSSVLDEESYRGWSSAMLEKLAASRREGGRLGQARLVVVEPGPVAFPDGWMEEHRPLVWARYLNLEGASLPVEIAEAGAISGDPGSAFRTALARMGAAFATGDAGSASAVHATAIAVAEAHGWPSLAAVADLSLASGLLAQGIFREAAARFEAAATRPDLEAPLALTARFGRANALLFAGEPVEAEKVYRACVPLTESLLGGSDPKAPDVRALLAFEAWRMAAHAALEGCSSGEALAAGQAALQVYGAAGEATRAVLLLRPLLECLERLAEAEPKLVLEIEAAAGEAGLTALLEDIRRARLAREPAEAPPDRRAG